MYMKKYTFDAGHNRSKFMERIDYKIEAYRFLENMIGMVALVLIAWVLLARAGEG